MTTSCSGLKIQALSFGYRQGPLILESIHAEFKRGKITALLGDNGSGKTTLLRILAGIIKQSSGSFFLNDVEITPCNLANYKTNLGYMPEVLQLYPDMRPMEVLHFFNQLRGGQREKIVEVLERVDLIKHKDKKIGELSKGMKQRLNLAQAIIGQPRLLILDEPSNGFDCASVSTFYEIIRELANQNTIVILSNHQFAELGDNADEVVVLANGKIHVQGSMAEFIGGVQCKQKRVWLYFDSKAPKDTLADVLKANPNSEWRDDCLMVSLEKREISMFISTIVQQGLCPSNVRIEGRELQTLLEAVK